jgi:hypothetical protein
MRFHTLLGGLAAAAATVQASQGGFEVTIVYVQPEAGCAAPPTTCDRAIPDGTIPAPVLEAVAAAAEPTYTATVTATAARSSKVFTSPAATLRPAVHWSVNTEASENVVPVPAAKGNKLYYGVNST